MGPLCFQKSPESTSGSGGGRRRRQWGAGCKWMQVARNEKDFKKLVHPAECTESDPDLPSTLAGEP